MKVSNEKIIEVCSNSLSMAKAAATLGIHFNTLKSRAMKLGCYKTNMAGKGLTRTKRDGFDKIALSEILDGKHPQYQSAPEYLPKIYRQVVRIKFPIED